MTGNEIIKAIELCLANDLFNSSCSKCPLGENDPYCMDKLLKGTSDLINRQKAEIERLTEEINALNGNTEKYIAECEKRSRETAEDYRKEIKSEAIREFAERLKATYPPREDKKCTLDDCYTLDVIDNLVKEMTEESNDQQKT